ncbi:MAG: hypothetical protein GX162_02560 [Firmicutes bacterium]|nr:hypothetical protein [Bacillota bacterium]
MALTEANHITSMGGDTMHVRFPVVSLSMFMVLVLFSLGTSAATISLVILDPSGEAADVSTVDVILHGEEFRETVSADMVFTDVPYGPHELRITRDDEVIHWRKLYIDRDEIKLTVQLAWEDLLKVFSWTEWESIPLENASFELPPVNGTPPGWRTGWHWPRGRTFAGRDYLSVSEEQAYAGRRSLKMDGTSARGIEKVTVVKPVPAVPGSLYTASARIYAKLAISPHPYMVISFWDEAGQRIHLRSVRSSGREGEWEDFSVTEIAPPGAAQVSVLLVGNTTYTGISYWDDIRLEVAHPVR